MIDKCPECGCNMAVHLPISNNSHGYYWVDGTQCLRNQLTQKDEEIERLRKIICLVHSSVERDVLAVQFFSQALMEMIEAVAKGEIK